MPFHNGVYYPYSSDGQGTHSSAGIPSLLNSPLSQHSGNGQSVSAPGMTPSSGISAGLPFRFRPRREKVDWRRIHAVDIDHVVSQLDVDVLQEHINTVTFCSLDAEQCQRCQSPVDLTLMKLFRLAQLSVEWLLHCQDFLTLNLRAAEERLTAADVEREKLLAEQQKQKEKMKAMTTELKQRRKIIKTQQSLFSPHLTSSQKCPCCDKSFLNAFYLQSHMQRRHPDEYETQLRSDGDKRGQIESLKQEINSLKEQIHQQQQELHTKTVQEKEQQSLQKELLRELERFKAEEMARMERKIEDSRDHMRREMEILYTRNIHALNEANLNLSAKNEKSASPVQSQAERDLDNYKELQLQAIQKLEQQMKKQDRKWESRLQDIKGQHESEKNELLRELSRTQSSVSDHQEQSQRLQQEMTKRLQEKEQTIKAQREQIRTLTSNSPAKVVEVPVIVSAPAPQPKPKKVVLEEPVCTLKLEPIQELSEEEKESSSLAEKKPTEYKPAPAPKKKHTANPAVQKHSSSSIKKDVRPEIEQALVVKLESMGVKPSQRGLKNKELDSILARMRSEQESFRKRNPDYWHIREEMIGNVEQELQTRTGGRSRQKVSVVQIRPRSSSLPSRTTQVTSGPATKESQTPQPAPRNKTPAQPKTSTPIAKTLVTNFLSKTPPFSSDEESEEEAEMEEEPQKLHKGKSQQPSLNQGVPVQLKYGKATPVLARQAAVSHSFSTSPQQSRALDARLTKTVVTQLASDDEEEDWSDVSELEQVDSRQFQSSKDQNGNVENRPFGKENKINDLARKMEKQFAERSVRKPAGGVSILPQRNDEVQKLTFTDLEDSSDSMVSSLEEKRVVSKLAPGPGPMKKSLDSHSTSVWGSSTGKGPKSGLTEAGTGSTLKSSLCSFSDFSDSEDEQ
ncbi:cilium assembly protein DZIP1 isoform X1 [Takifugu flavidus]|uniref:cilium assembly protein DZIP1 isoform X1 n=2 Tax=Takifugu flavidus TaxID=433684 RepID=UPI0025445D6E|nr:cilium assembly protein DZIP1 isoform X1 [Takifugu flavidus]